MYNTSSVSTGIIGVQIRRPNARTWTRSPPAGRAECYLFSTGQLMKYRFARAARFGHIKDVNFPFGMKPKGRPGSLHCVPIDTDWLCSFSVCALAAHRIQLHVKVASRARVSWRAGGHCAHTHTTYAAEDIPNCTLPWK